MTATIIGISAYYHDSAAALIINGEIVAAAQEERFSRVKNDHSFPVNAIGFVLDYARLTPAEVDLIVFYDKPLLKFDRLLETYHQYAPKGLISFAASMPVWIREKLFLRNTIERELRKVGKFRAKLLFAKHHLSHAASAFYPSPFEEAAILTIDGVGEWTTTSIAMGQGNKITAIKELHFPHSLGLLYSAFTYYCGFAVNSDEYKLMGLAPYGNPNNDQTRLFKKIILDQLIDIREDGSFLLNMNFFNYATGLRMTNNKKWSKLFGFPPRKPESEITSEYMNLAYAIQEITEDVLLKLAQTAKSLTRCEYLVLAGGVALNSVANGKILKSGLFNDIWIQPASGDAGGSLGAALAAWYIYLSNNRIATKSDEMKGCLLGPSFTDSHIETVLSEFNLKYRKLNHSDLLDYTTSLIQQGKVIGWFQGRMEFGPRALGNRSILADPCNPEIQKRLNLKIKFREGFRPFAPAVIEEEFTEYFDINHKSPYMLHVVPLREKYRFKTDTSYPFLPLYQKLYTQRSSLPAITHVDFSARIQTVSKNDNPLFHSLLTKYKKINGYPILVNTSFNVRGEPIVCSPKDAVKCFLNTDMDCMVIGNFIVEK